MTDCPIALIVAERLGAIHARNIAAHPQTRLQEREYGRRALLLAEAAYGSLETGQRVMLDAAGAPA